MAVHIVSKLVFLRTHRLLAQSPTEPWRKPVVFKLAFPQSKLVSLPLSRSCSFGTLFCFSCCSPIPLNLVFLYPSPNLLHSASLNTWLPLHWITIFFIYFFYSTCKYQKKRYRMSKVNYLLSMCILGLQVAFKSLEAIGTGLHLCSY